MNIYFICTGNTCRSPMAEAILRSKQIDGVTVRSAGIHALDGLPISLHAETVIKRSDMPYTAVSSALTAESLEWADLVLTMTTSHKDAILRAFPFAAGKTYTLKEYVWPDQGGDVLDPYGGSLELYEQTFDELSTLIGQLKTKLTEDEG
ncbi:low molecular weight protein arginine phosphatase [Sporosarcina saromensis]|uniref:Low molecular weight protein arginine phosphatase n=1 Tax=Sporosarcina saromensis TaxID=359365 RepID=A0ABU4GB08_9BACL|nr:low molecular weight protein arginine phosphatase [Sporosarcina saromensis]MDW0114086.1 low molecular weight protein arginine phosphatase [Sporosarcina saromensis]